MASATSKKILAILRHPFFPFIPFVIFMAKVKENYPFTNYPMYSTPGPGPISYFYLTDAQDNPLPVKVHCGITSPRVKRLFETKLKQVGREQPQLTDAERHRLVLDEVFPFLRTAAERKNRPLPAPPLRMHRGLLYQTDAGFDEEVALVGEEGAPTANGLPARRGTSKGDASEESGDPEEI